MLCYSSVQSVGSRIGHKRSYTVIVIAEARAIVDQDGGKKKCVAAGREVLRPGNLPHKHIQHNPVYRSVSVERHGISGKIALASLPFYIIHTDIQLGETGKR